MTLVTSDPWLLVPTVVNENTCPDWLCGGRGWVAATEDGAAGEGTRVAWMTLVAGDPWLLVLTVVKESTCAEEALN
jgi:hypothetical protein